MLVLLAPIFRLIYLINARLSLLAVLLFYKERKALWAIALHESGNFTNSNSKKRSNFFNFAWVGNSLQWKKGISTAPGEPVFAVYFSPVQSVLHVIEWFESRDEAYKYLKAFAEEPSYLAAIRLAQAMHQKRFFTADPVSYANSLWSYYQVTPYSTGITILSLVAFLLVPTLVSLAIALIVLFWKKVIR